jgi:hypothetical protein
MSRIEATGMMQYVRLKIKFFTIPILVVFIADNSMINDEYFCRVKD